MVIGRLTNEQNIRSAVVFLNLFGLKLEEKDELDENTRLKIVNADDEQVGEVYFDGNLIKIDTVCVFGSLKAEYEKEDYTGYDGSEGAFAVWNNTINYTIEKNEREKFVGNVTFDVTIGDLYEYRLYVRPSIGYYLDDEEKIKMVFFRNNNNISIELKDKDKKVEEIEISSMFYHVMYAPNNEGSYDFRNLDEYSVRVYENRMFAVKKCCRNGKVVSQEEIVEPQECYGPGFYIQQGNVMKKIDPHIMKKMADIENVFKMEDVNLLYNLLSVSLQDVSFGHDEQFDCVVSALLGVKSKPLIYQNGSTNSYDAYFGMSKSDTFSMQKILNKKNS